MKKYRRSLFLLIPAAAAAVAALFFSGHIFIQGAFYSRNASSIDLRGKNVTAEEYTQLQNQLPECEILWDVPLSSGAVSCRSRELTLSALTESDLDLLQHFPGLERITAESAVEQEQLLRLLEWCPDLDIRYTITIDGTTYPSTADKLTISAITDGEIGLLEYLPGLTAIDATGCSDLDQLMKLRHEYPDCDLTYRVPVGGTVLSQDARELTLTGAEPEAVLSALAYLPEMESVTLLSPKADSDHLLQLQQQYPHISFYWEMEVLGLPVTTGDREIDFSQVTVDIENLEAGLACFPNLETVYLGECGIDNDALAAYRDRVRDQYKVVWLLRLGLMPVRTDATTFMPGRPSDRYFVTDEQMDLLRYCEDMICLDIGHYTNITRCEWAAHMPRLKYLLLADTGIYDVSPLADLKELIYLELFLTPVYDLSPLVNLKTLEDLNLCFTLANPEPVKQMTWLKRLWWAKCPLTVAQFKEYLPDTEMMFYSVSSTGLGWREGQNYYDMRDLLGLHYMTG